MDKNKIKVIFMGTPEIAGIVLKGLIDDGYNVCLVVANEDRKVGRKGVITPCPTKIIAQENNIEVFQPSKIRNDFARIQEVNADILITCAYGQIVPKEVLQATRIGAFNVHGSLLPLLRGASPIQSALFNGFSSSGVSIMEMVEAMDAGDVYYQKEITIDEDDNYSSLYNKIAILGRDSLLECLPKIIEGSITPFKQNENSVTFCRKIEVSQEHLNLALLPDDFINQVRGLSYVPGGYVILDDKKLKILKAIKYKDDDKQFEVGQLFKISKNRLGLQLKQGQIELLEVQKESKNKTDAASFINGQRDIDSKIVS